MTASLGYLLKYRNGGPGLLVYAVRLPNGVWTHTDDPAAATRFKTPDDALELARRRQLRDTEVIPA